MVNIISCYTKHRCEKKTIIEELINLMSKQYIIWNNDNCMCMPKKKLKYFDKISNHNCGEQSRLVIGSQKYITAI